MSFRIQTLCFPDSLCKYNGSIKLTIKEEENRFHNLKRTEIFSNSEIMNKSMRWPPIWRNISRNKLSNYYIYMLILKTHKIQKKIMTHILKTSR